MRVQRISRSRRRQKTPNVAAVAALAAVATFGLVVATWSETPAASAADRAPNGTRTERDGSGMLRAYGTPVKVGNGMARTYVLLSKDGAAPAEIGVALDERAMEGLPKPNAQHAATTADGHEHVDNHVFLLSLPDEGVAPFKFVELDWNPGGHEPPGVYDTPHFDFHFYTVEQAARAAIVPSDPQFQQKADMLPPEAQRPPLYAVAAPPGQPAPGVPLMGVHWIDVRSPELQQMFGKPEAYKPFTTTFLYGSWQGKYHFWEPMITRAYIMAKKSATDPKVRDEVIPIPAPASYSEPGYYPNAYRIAYDAKAKEYRIALTSLEWRQ